MRDVPANGTRAKDTDEGTRATARRRGYAGGDTQAKDMQAKHAGGGTRAAAGEREAGESWPGGR